MNLKPLLESRLARTSAALLLAFAVGMGFLNPALALLPAAALMAKAIESQGITIGITVGSPTNMTTIANVTGFDGPGGSASVIDVSNLSSTAKEKMIGLADEGQLSLDLNFDPDDATHIGMRNARTSRTRCEFTITFTDSTPATAKFFGYILQFRVQGALDQVVKARVTIEIDGAITWA